MYGDRKTEINENKLNKTNPNCVREMLVLKHLIALKCFWGVLWLPWLRAQNVFYDSHIYSYLVS